MDSCFHKKTEKMSYFWSTAEVEGHKVNLPKTDGINAYVVI